MLPSFRHLYRLRFCQQPYPIGVLTKIIPLLPLASPSYMPMIRRGYAAVVSEKRQAIGPGTLRLPCPNYLQSVRQYPARLRLDGRCFASRSETSSELASISVLASWSATRSYAGRRQRIRPFTRSDQRPIPPQPTEDPQMPDQLYRRLRRGYDGSINHDRTPAASPRKPATETRRVHAILTGKGGVGENLRRMVSGSVSARQGDSDGGD